MASFISSIGLTLLPQLGSIVVGSNFKTYPQIEVWYNVGCLKFIKCFTYSNSN